MRSTIKALSLAALATVLLGGCGGGSVMQGQGTVGGLGNPGTGTGNPDATVVCRMRGAGSGDFEATDVKTTLNVLGFQVQGSGISGPTTGRLLRVLTVRFNGLPVAGTTYVVGGLDELGAAMQYVERNEQTSQAKVWDGSGGTIHVTSVTTNHVDATFKATLDPSLNATGSITASAGEIHVKYH
jgi:hypothetical protein